MQPDISPEKPYCHEAADRSNAALRPYGWRGGAKLAVHTPDGGVNIVPAGTMSKAIDAVIKERDAQKNQVEQQQRKIEQQKRTITGWYRDFKTVNTIANKQREEIKDLYEEIKHLRDRVVDLAAYGSFSRSYARASARRSMEQA